MSGSCSCRAGQISGVEGVAQTCIFLLKAKSLTLTCGVVVGREYN